MNKQYQEWMALRSRLHAEERAFARAQQGLERGEDVDVQLLSIQYSEIRALRALSASLARRAAAAGKPSPEGQERPRSN